MTTKTPTNAPILENIKVLDIASFIAGPAAATIMADFGAKVIKIEPLDGDPYRSLLGMPGMPKKNETDYHWQLDNRHKKGIAIDLKQIEGQAVVHKLATNADVLITNYTHSAREKLKLTYEDIKPLNAKLVYASMTAYGETGPEADRTGFDTTAYWARSGLMHLVRPDPEGPPARSLPGMGDHPTAMALFGAIMLGLFRREHTGCGGQVHSSLMANGLWSNGFYGQAALSGSTIEPRPKRDNWPNALTNHYRTKDGHWFILALVRSEREWKNLLAAIARMELSSDIRFSNATNRQKFDNNKELTKILDDVFAKRDWCYWEEALRTNRVTFGNVANAKDIIYDQQMSESSAVVTDDTTSAEASKMINSPLWVEGSHKMAPKAAPSLGEHTDEVLLENGLTPDDLTKLKRHGIILNG